MTDTPAWPQMERGRPVPGWRQPPGQPAAPAPRPGDPAVVDASTLGVPLATPPVETAPPRVCAECGGAVDADGYCTQCGAKAPSERDHFEESPASWVGAVCDRGVRHARNEDALATAAEAEPGSRAVLVVCDGVTSSDDSDVASLAAARAARDVLAEGRPEALGSPASQLAALTGAFARAAAVANDAVVAHTAPGAANPAACTFVGAVVTPGLVVVGNVGDSRAYWLPDTGEGRILTRDDSMAEDSIAAGIPRKEAETAADAHTITRWLGVDATDVVPHVATQPITGPGWVVVCSDGLWNYASEAAELDAVLRGVVTELEDAAAAVAEPAAPEPAPAGDAPAPDAALAAAATPVAAHASATPDASDVPTTPAGPDTMAAPPSPDAPVTPAAPDAPHAPGSGTLAAAHAAATTESGTPSAHPALAGGTNAGVRPPADVPAASVTPLAVAQGLVRFAIGRGGHDNISAAVARVGVVPQPAPDAPGAADDDRPTSRTAHPGQDAAAASTPAEPRAAEPQATASTPAEQQATEPQAAASRSGEAPAAEPQPVASELEDYDPITHTSIPRGGATAYRSTQPGAAPSTPPLEG